MARHTRRSKHNRARRAPVAQRASATIRMIGARGDGVGVTDDGDEIYIPYAAVGDCLDIEYADKRGRILEVIEPGPDRITAPCRHYGKCGGCAMQHVSDEFYRQWKRELVVSALNREGFDDSLVASLVACPAASRRRAVFSVQRSKDSILFGFRRRQSHAIEDVVNCEILCSPLADKLEGLRKFSSVLSAIYPKFTMTATACDNGIDVAIHGGLDVADLGGAVFITLSDAAREAGLMRVTIEDEPLVAFAQPRLSFGPIEITPPPGGFLQASRNGERALVDLVMDAVGDARNVADLFCGAGTFTGPLSVLSSVSGFDSDDAAIAALDKGARAASLAHPVRAIRRNLFLSPLLAAELKPFDAVVFDPPRAGAEAQARELAQSGAPLVVGVSCNPKTFARDATILRDGGYVLQNVTPVDQFAYAAHVEMVGVFKRG